ncbi:hypothetical protein [Rubrivivax gelatinosus]|uniref:HupE/UreJ protein n=1 Tax=Rubrivivax gelatinosus TaxID=28068 RepID=A0A4R2M9Z9_RUBGE|nr:hypothetical protein [Rubrivivax gelatinosus]MBK1688030.1 hypothetical protein [Rubrivivax gelatinosus]TCO99315.1 hypothetical protein EV684_115108 [Rubrivivax gelatinosus]
MRGRRAAAATLALPLPALAHGAVKAVDAFYDGALHLLLTPAAAIALLALGLALGQRGLQAARPALAALALALAAGLLAGAAPGPAIARELLLVLAVLTGLSVVLHRPWPPLALVPMAALVGAAAGWVSAPGPAVGAVRAGSLLGAFVAALLLAACAAGLVQQARPAWARIGVRVAGSWLTASAVMVLMLVVVRG